VKSETVVILIKINTYKHFKTFATLFIAEFIHLQYYIDYTQ
jgi:hypothetical protein